MFRAKILPIFRSIRLYTTACSMLYLIRCRWVIWWWMNSITRSPTVHCAEDVAQATSSAQCTHLATRLSGTTTATARTENHRQWHAVCSPDDGRKDARNMLRNNWLQINHYLLHLVGLAFILLSKMRGHLSIKYKINQQMCLIKYNSWQVSKLPHISAPGCHHQEVL